MKAECQLGNIMDLLQWLDFFNSTIVPFVFMIALSIALIHSVRVSRARVHTSSGAHSQSKRDNRFAISAITLNLVFLFLNLPIVIDDLLAINIIPNYIFDYTAQLLYYLYYAIGFYAQLLVNSEFRSEFVRMFVHTMSATTNGEASMRTNNKHTKAAANDEDPSCH